MSLLLVSVSKLLFFQLYLNIDCIRVFLHFKFKFEVSADCLTGLLEQVHNFGNTF